MQKDKRGNEKLNTEIKNVLSAADDKAQYDAYAKKLIAQKSHGRYHQADKLCTVVKCRCYLPVVGSCGTAFVQLSGICHYLHTAGKINTCETTCCTRPEIMQTILGGQNTCFALFR